MASSVLIVGKSLRENAKEAETSVHSKGDRSAIAIEADVFRNAGKMSDDFFSQTPKGSSRKLVDFYSLRAYPGAPPSIPHTVAKPHTIGNNVCLQCHESGGYVPKFKAFAPVTPHPEFASCLQCHSVNTTNSTFVNSDWKVPAPPSINQEALSGGPPPIPHALQLRGNCLACHSGPGAVEELRFTHAERTNCLQCHALNSSVSPWQRAQ